MSGDRLAHERAQLIHGLNGHEVDADTAWAIIHRWDALVEVAKAARVAMASVDDTDFENAVISLRLAFARLDSGATEEDA